MVQYGASGHCTTQIGNSHRMKRKSKKWSGSDPIGFSQCTELKPNFVFDTCDNCRPSRTSLFSSPRRRFRPRPRQDDDEQTGSGLNGSNSDRATTASTTTLRRRFPGQPKYFAAPNPDLVLREKLDPGTSFQRKSDLKQVFLPSTPTSPSRNS